MNPRARRAAVSAVLFPFRLLPRPWQIRLGNAIHNGATGDNNGDFETNGEFYVLSRAAARLSGRQSVVFDVGANVGDWTIEAQRRFSNFTTLYAFEPFPKTFLRLKENLARAGGEKVVAVPAGLGDVEKSLKIFGSGTDADASKTNSLYRREGVGGEFVAQDEVQIRTGDQFCKDSNIAEVDFVKLDVEGHEMAALRGFKGMLANKQIGCVQFEYGGTWVDARTFLIDAFQLARPLGYTVAKVHRHGIELLGEYRQSLDNFAYANFLLLRDDWVGAFDPIR
jgi:FkbM family methyltransferase